MFICIFTQTYIKFLYKKNVSNVLSFKHKLYTKIFIKNNFGCKKIPISISHRCYHLHPFNQPEKMVSANKVYRESGSSLPFKDWLEREKNKGSFIPNAQALKEFENFDGEENPKEEINEFAKDSTINTIVIVAVVGIVLFGIYKFTKK